MPLRTGGTAEGQLRDPGLPVCGVGHTVVGEFVLRAAPDVDLYVLYDDGANQFTAFGTRSEIRAVLCANPHSRHDPEPRLLRADRHGTSAVFGNRFGGWRTPRLPVFWHGDTEGSWWLRRDRLVAYARSMLAHEDDTAAALLEPITVGVRDADEEEDDATHR